MPGKVKAQVNPDSSFNKYGYRFFNKNPAVGSMGMKVVPGADGTVFVAGMNGGDSLTVWKYLANGSPDLSFGYGGFSSRYIGSGGFLAYPLNMDLIVQRNRKIVVLATRIQLKFPDHYNSQTDIVLARFNSDGSPDLTFNGSGLLVDRPDAGYQFRAFGLAIDSTGINDKFYVSSMATENGSWNCPVGSGKWCISRYTATGLRDPGFNGQGYMLQTSSYIRNTPTNTPMAVPLAMRVLSSGKLLVAGIYNAVDSGCFIFRLNANGAFDAAYGTAGRIYRKWSLIYSGSVSPYAFRAKILKDESVIFSGGIDLYSNGGKYDSSIVHVIKHDSKGAALTSFGTGGTMKASYRGEGMHDLAVDGSNRILVSWNVADAYSRQMHFTCFTPQGIPDTSFSATGGHISLEPILHDTLTQAPPVYSTAWTSDNEHFFVLEYRFNQAYKGHIGLLKYKLPAKKEAQTAIATARHDEIVIYPQPADKVLNIRAAGTRLAAFTMVNASGQIVMEQHAIGEDHVSVDLQHLAPGLYILHLQDMAGSVVNRPVIIVH